MDNTRRTSRPHARRPAPDLPPPASPRALVIDDDPIVAESLAEFLRREGHEAATGMSGAEGLALLDDADTAARPFGLVICDVAMPGMSGLDTLRAIVDKHPGVVVVMLTAYATIESAVQAVRAGAADYLTKPVIEHELRISLERAVRHRALLAENATLKRQLKGRFGLENIVGADHRMVRIYELLETVAPTRTTVLMTGETGAGKSLIARAIHNLSPRAAAPFVELSCGSIPETLLESELFGHAKGAFTGAHADKPGRFLAADRGTIFLDEINSASPAMQLKLLRVLQERRFEPVGSTETIEVDTRVILASNQPLEPLVAQGAFRQDLYYRINVVRIDLPPLRERVADIPLLAEHFLRAHAREAGKQVAGLAPDAVEALQRYAFPGNVRELSNIIERAVVLARRPTITLDDLPPSVVENRPATLEPPHASDSSEAAWTPMPLEQALAEPEKRILLKALRANAWNRQATADQLSINRTTLYKKMKAYGLDRLAG